MRWDSVREGRGYVKIGQQLESISTHSIHNIPSYHILSPQFPSHHYPPHLFIDIPIISPFLSLPLPPSTVLYSTLLYYSMFSLQNIVDLLGGTVPAVSLYFLNLVIVKVQHSIFQQSEDSQ